MALVLLGVLGVPQTPARAQASVQPRFQQDQVRRPPPGPHGRPGSVEGLGGSLPGPSPGERR